ncbi:MAG: outer membrane beta-barrel protein, partial [Bacteroidales bacterium]|nr:outer membrane beta-barrel protein [Bacteroidales bacterium]
ILFGAGLLFTQPLQAGIDNLKRAEFELHVGPGFPLGKFGQKAFPEYRQNPDGTAVLGYHGANIGVNYGLAFQFYASPNWGVLLLFNGHSNTVNADAFSSFNTDAKWKTTSKGKWTEFMAMAGITYRCLLAERFVFSARAYLGYAHLIAPYYSSEAQISSFVTYTYQLRSSSDANFGYGAGVAFKYLLARGFHLDLRCDYMGAVPFYFRRVNSFSQTRVVGVDTPEPTPYKNTFHENFQMINLSLGFTFAF